MASTYSRRDFLKRSGLAAIAGSAILSACRKQDNTTNSEEGAAGSIPKGRMDYRVNPKNGDKVSLLGYGCMRWPYKADNDSELDQEEINRLVDKAMEYGVNYFDTSPAYLQGMSEKATGIALARHPRDSYFIATKLSNFDPSTWPLEEGIKMYRNSMRDLQTDHIDYMLLHCLGVTDDPMGALKGRFIDNGLLDFLLKEREAGRIRNLGFSWHGDVAIYDQLLSWHEKYHWDFVQIQSNYLEWNNGTDLSAGNVNTHYLYEELVKRDIPVIIMEPLLGGRLAKLPDHAVEMLKSREPQKSVASWAFRYAGTRPEVLTVLSGMTYMEHLEDNLRTFCPLKPLSEEEMEFLHGVAGVIASYPTVQCNECQYCMPCPYGLDIPAIFSHYNKCVNQGNVPDSPEAAGYADARRAFLVGYDRSVPKLRQASHCVGCGKCKSHCPQNIDIPGELAHIDVLAESLRQGTPPEMSALVSILKKGNYSLVVDNGRITKYNQRGIKDLYSLLTEKPRMLDHARVADKVIGKAAASLMILGKVKEIHTGIISTPAKELLANYPHIKLSYDKEVPEILQPNGEICPMEARCADTSNIYDMRQRIENFMNAPKKA